MDLGRKVNEAKVPHHFEALLEVVNEGLVVRGVFLFHDHLVKLPHAPQIPRDLHTIGDQLGKVCKTCLLDEQLQLNASEVTSNHTPPPANPTVSEKLSHDTRKVFLEVVENILYWP